MKPLFIPLCAEYYDAFAARRKTVEYRPYGPRWNEGTCRIGRSVVLSRGYGRKNRLEGIITRFRVRGDVEAIPGWCECYGYLDAAAACISIRLL